MGPSARSTRGRKTFGKNTIDLQWKMRANYNARLCAGFRKAAAAKTMANMGKNNAQSNRNSRKSGRVLTSGRGAGRQATALRAEALPSGPSLLRDFWISLGAQRPD